MDTARKHEIAYQIFLREFIHEMREEGIDDVCFLYRAEPIIRDGMDGVDRTDDEIDSFLKEIIDDFLSINNSCDDFRIDRQEILDFSLTLIKDVQAMLVRPCPECGSCDNFAYRETYIECNRCGERFGF